MTDRQETATSRTLEPGVMLRYRPSGSLVVITRRKDDDSGWWLRDGEGGLDDSAIDLSEDWEVLGLLATERRYVVEVGALNPDQAERLFDALLHVADLLTPGDVSVSMGPATDASGSSS